MVGRRSVNRRYDLRGREGATMKGIRRSTKNEKKTESVHEVRKGSNISVLLNTLVS